MSLSSAAANDGVAPDTSLARAVVRDAAAGVGIATTPEGLTALHHPGCAAVIWRRQRDPAAQVWLDAVPPERLPSARIILPVHAARVAIHDVCVASGLPTGSERDALADDMAMLAHRFAALLNAQYLRVRLDVTDRNACSRFHIDAVPARLICTYRGTGTQYGVSADGIEPKRVFTVPTGAPIVLRGTRWVGGAPSGLLHRSPPVAGTGETRLLLVVDPIDDPDDEI